jgi:hypothetical protein
MNISLFALHFPPFGGARINECTTQGKVTRKNSRKRNRHTFFNKYNTTVLIAFMAAHYKVNIVDGEPAYEEKKNKHTDKKK